MGRGPVITRICWRLVDSLSCMLDTDERQTVRGDLAESGETGREAVSDVLGLVVRRHAVLWADWRPWLSFVGLIVPLGMVLSLMSRSTSGLSAIYIWMYANNWEWGDVRNAGFLHEFELLFERGLVERKQRAAGRGRVRKLAQRKNGGMATSSALATSLHLFPKACGQREV